MLKITKKKKKKGKIKTLYHNNPLRDRTTLYCSYIHFGNDHQTLDTDKVFYIYFHYFLPSNLKIECLLYFYYNKVSKSVTRVNT